MTITTLKVIALILMTIDHIGSFIFPDVMWLRYIGRLSAPLFIFCVTEAMRHTCNQRKYLIQGTLLIYVIEAVRQKKDKWQLQLYHLLRYIPVYQSICDICKYRSEITVLWE